MNKLMKEWMRDREFTQTQKEKLKNARFGICVQCDDDHKQPLYKVGNHWVCGACANEYEGSSMEYDPRN